MEVARFLQRADTLANDPNPPMPVTKKSTPVKPANDWRNETLDRMRKLILAADPAMIEERKWQKPTNPEGVILWSHSGMICTGEKYKDKVKLTFAYGAALPDPNGLFNAPFTGATRRAMDIKEGDEVDAKAFKTLVKAAVTWNNAKAKKK
ncbi:MAG TPA: DUF1801 domain-containing protein [Flavobacteriales bacterium]|nr:DUF1801 domain-containing protein [Flavobacteriales bacterium]